MATKQTFGAALTSSSQTIYTVPDHRQAEWVLMYITNTSGSNGNVTVSYTDDSESATLSIFDGYTISAKEYVQIGGGFNEFIMMEAGDSISASATQPMSLLVSVIEHNSNR